MDQLVLQHVVLVGLEAEQQQQQEDWRHFASSSDIATPAVLPSSDGTQSVPAQNSKR
jgi:hypothetical protein